MGESRLNERIYWLGGATSAFSLSAYHIGGDDARAYDQRLPVVYMRRWILHTPVGDLRLHHILRSDRDRDLHDHPFDFWTFLLTDGYTEWLPADHPDGQREKAEIQKSIRFMLGQLGWLDALQMLADLELLDSVPVRRGMWSLRYVQAETLHRLELDRPVWTLVWSWPKRREWGFRVDGKWVNARTYLARQETP